ncbi:hypothetical protein ACJX0J_011806, partial [Zea mays]
LLHWQLEAGGRGAGQSGGGLQLAILRSSDHGPLLLPPLVMAPSLRMLVMVLPPMAMAATPREVAADTSLVQPSRRVGNDLVIAPGETINGAVGEAAEVLPSVLCPSTEGAELNVGDVRVSDGMPDRQAEELLPDKEAEELIPDRQADESLGRALDGLVSPRCLSSLVGTAEEKGQCEAEELFPDRQADESLGRALDGLVSPRCLSSLAGTAEEIGQCEAAGQGCPTLKVYSRRRQRDPLQQTPSPLEDTSVESDHVKDTTPVCDFVALVTKKTD